MGDGLAMPDPPRRKAVSGGKAGRDTPAGDRPPGTDAGDAPMTNAGDAPASMGSEAPIEAPATIEPVAALPDVAPTVAFEFALPTAQAARLMRASSLTSLRAGRGTAREFRILWHDTADRALLREGLALAEEDGAWRLERARSALARAEAAAPTLWLPATTAPVLARAAVATELPGLPGGHLMPVAGFAGRARTMPLGFAAGPGTLEVLEGSLRGVAADAPACRVRMTGPAEAVAGLALRLAQTVELAPPETGLAEAALMVGGAPAPPAPRGAPAIAPGETVEEGLVRVTAHLAETLLYWAPRAPAGATPEPVHQMRVAARRLRSALVFFRRAADGAETRGLATSLRDLAAVLGQARDWDVFLAGAGQEVTAAFAGDRRVAALLGAAARRREAAYEGVRAALSGPEWRLLRLRLAMLPSRRPWREGADGDRLALLGAGAEAFAGQVLDRRLKRLTATGPALDALPAVAQHEVRKEAKRLRYAAEFAAPLFGQKKRRRFLERLEDVQAALGAVNDAHVAAMLMAELPGGADRAFAAGAVLGYVAAAGRKRQSAAGRAWEKLLAEPPFWH